MLILISTLHYISPCSYLLFCTYIYAGDTGLQGLAGLPGIKGIKGDQGNDNYITIQPRHNNF